MCVKEIVVETFDTCLRYTAPSAMKIFGLRISNFTQIRMWLHHPVSHCRFPATFSRLGFQLQPRLLHWPTSICAGVTILSMSQSTGQHSSCKKNWDNCTEYSSCCDGYSLRSLLSLFCCKFICWCLEYRSCCDYLLCCHCVLCLPATVTCPLIVQEASVCTKSFSNSYTAGSPCPCAWHQESATHRYVLAAFLCSIAEHEVATITLTIANTVYGTMWYVDLTV